MFNFTIPADDTWRDIKGYEGLYQVNRDGQVMRIGRKITTKRGSVQSYPAKILKPYRGQVYLSKEGKVATLRVSMLVAQAFLDGYTFGDPVYHIEGDSDALSNLTLHVDSPAEDSDWKYIPDTNNCYMASRFGEIRSVDRPVYGHVRPGKQLSLHTGEDGYLHCMLSIDGQSTLKSVHRLVAQTWIPNPENKPQVNHIDGSKTNNRVDNLEWVTQAENMQHAKDTGLWNPEACGNVTRMSHGIKVRCIDDNREYDSISAAAKYYNMDFESVKESIILNKPRKGLRFEYIDKEINKC